YNAGGRWGWLDESPLKGGMEVVAGDLADRDSVQAAEAGGAVVFNMGALVGVRWRRSLPPGCADRYPVFVWGAFVLCAHECRRHAECAASSARAWRGPPGPCLHQRGVWHPPLCAH